MGQREGLSLAGGVHAQVKSVHKIIKLILFSLFLVMITTRRGEQGGKKKEGQMLSREVTRMCAPNE